MFKDSYSHTDFMPKLHISIITVISHERMEFSFRTHLNALRCGSKLSLEKFCFA